ncbi:MAG: alpha/beta fold hydrolase [Bdellovibrionota bacterium]
MIPTQLPVLRGLSIFFKVTLPRLGFRWELRRSGELKIGLWRKRLGTSKKPHPKRLIFVPGFGDSAISWLSVLGILLPKLSRQFDEVVLLDFPGFTGFLSRERAFHSFDLLLGATQDILDSLRPHTVVGHSLGAWIVADYAAQCGEGERPKKANRFYRGPERVILGDPAGVFESEEKMRHWERKFRDTETAGFANYRPELFASEPFYFRFMAHEFEAFLKREEIVQFMHSIREDHLLEEKLHRIRSRVFLFWGELDTLSPPAVAAVWMKGLPPIAEPKAFSIERAGHSPHLERPAVTAKMLGMIFRDDAAALSGRQEWRALG